MHTLLYSGATTKIYAHMVLWFGESNHMNIGYSETNAVQVQNQIDDMVSRGIDGVIIDWYGPNNSIDEANATGDGGGGEPSRIYFRDHDRPGGDRVVLLLRDVHRNKPWSSDLQYIENTYFPSPAYMTIQGQPVITEFQRGSLLSVGRLECGQRGNEHASQIYFPE